MIGRFAAFFLLNAGCLFGAAGTWRWWNAWVYLVFMTGISVLVGRFFRESPDLAEERRGSGRKAKAWDRVLVPILTIVLPFSANLLAGLDRRYAWTTSITAPWALLALAGMIGSSALIFQAMRANRFFSAHVRIQTDRGQTVVDGGPYRYVRHPGYTGAIVYNLAVPILLGSLVAFRIGLTIAVLFVIRTALEDRTLQNELPGYRRYAETTRYRLLPRVW